MPGDKSKGAKEDVVVIGAGAAGIAAARRLQAIRPDLSILLLEAGDRLGGRAWTASLPEAADIGLDLGCGWLHGARTNAWTAIAGEVGLAVDRTPAPWNDGGRRLQRDDAEARAAREAIGAYFERLEGHEGNDAAMADMLEPGNPWNGQIRAIGTYITGAELERSSITTDTIPALALTGGCARAMGRWSRFTASRFGQGSAPRSRASTIVMPAVSPARRTRVCLVPAPCW